MVAQAAGGGGLQQQHHQHHHGSAYAAGGARGKAALSEAKRNAEALFESRTVAEIREVRSSSVHVAGIPAHWSVGGSAIAPLLRAPLSQIEARTRKDIEAKKQQLRQLVGDSYRSVTCCGVTRRAGSRAVHKAFDLHLQRAAQVGTPAVAIASARRDLIDSADKIVNMAGNCGAILQNIKDIQVRARPPPMSATCRRL